jgi:predicted PurR-regulated permease PerM
VILSLIFWYWMWGIPGAIVADRLPPFRAFCHLLEE